MTTIICDRRAQVIVADSFREVNGNTMLRSAIKVHLHETGLLAGSGYAENVALWVEWLTNGEPRDQRPTLEDTTCIRLSRAGHLDVYGTRCIALPIDEPYYALGSGCEFALAALYCGKDALDAMRVAAHFNAYTRPPFLVYSLKADIPERYEE